MKGLRLLLPLLVCWLGFCAVADARLDVESKAPNPITQEGVENQNQTASEIWLALNEEVGSEQDSKGREGARSFQQELADGFRYSIRVLGFGIVRDPVESPLTFGSVSIPGALVPIGPERFDRVDSSLLNSYQLEADIRPDFYLDYRQLGLMVKPRFDFMWKKWDEGPKDGETSETSDIYVNEWLARIKFQDSLFLSYGRENLQWGPSYLFSPSNPFIRNNNRNNPYVEVRGADFARAVWTPSYNWSTSFIANTDDGEHDYSGEFDEGYAVKIDYTGEKKFFSLIPQYNYDEDFYLGFFAGWNLTDAFLAYSDGRFNDKDYQFLFGGSYTLRGGQILTAEYYHNSEGSRDEPFFTIFPPFGDIEDLNEPYFRKNYLLLQFSDTEIRDVLDITLRWIADLDDGSTRSVAIFSYEVGDHMELFTVGAYDSGGSDEEFGSVIQYSVFAGVQYTF